MIFGCFIWDDKKNQINIKKHGIDFRTASKIFADNNKVELYDSEHSLDEERYILIGSIDGMITVLTVVYTEQNNYFRIISARKSNEKERRLYYGSHR